MQLSKLMEVPGMSKKTRRARDLPVGYYARDATSCWSNAHWIRPTEDLIVQLQGYGATVYRVPDMAPEDEFMIGKAKPVGGPVRCSMVSYTAGVIRDTATAALVFCTKTAVRHIVVNVSSLEDMFLHLAKTWGYDVGRKKYMEPTRIAGEYIWTRAYTHTRTVYCCSKNGLGHLVAESCSRPKFMRLTDLNDQQIRLYDTRKKDLKEVGQCVSYGFGHRALIVYPNGLIRVGCTTLFPLTAKKFWRAVGEVLDYEITE